MLSIGNWWSLARVPIVALLIGAAPLGLSASKAYSACPNEELRVGPSAALPDCRAFELTTPAEASGQTFEDIDRSFSHDVFPTELASSLRNSILFTTKGFGFMTPSGNGGGLARDVWRAERGNSGWQMVQHMTPGPTESLEPLAGGVSADHSFEFFFAGPESSAPVSGNPGSLYVEHGGADYIGNSAGQFELTGCGSLGCEPLVQGRFISPGGQHVIFSTGKGNGGSVACSLSTQCKAKQLEPTAAPSGTGAIYDRAAGNGPTNVISLRPGNLPFAAGEEAEYLGVSADGRTVAFQVKGALYVRVKDEKTELVTAESASFAGISETGRYLCYVRGHNIYRFDTSDESTEVVNSSGDALLMNVSEDGSHIYFLSPSQLDGGKGEKGEPNLYSWSGGSPGFIATVEQSDTEGFPSLGKWLQVFSPAYNPPQGPGVEASRTTPDGTVIVFESTARLTTYDNNGQPEIYRRSNGQPVECVSCNPSGEPATAGARLEEAPGALKFEMVLNNLSSDGTRVFFETPEALVPTDMDDVNDVYEWHSAPSLGGEPAIGLISSGNSRSYPTESDESFDAGLEQNTLFAITKSGSDVFFKSLDSLVPGAAVGGAPAIYDARIGGGFPQPPVAVPCSEEGCRPPVSPPPALGSAGSASLEGTGNVSPKKKKHHHHRRCNHRHKKHKACPNKRVAAALKSAGNVSTEAFGGNVLASFSASPASSSPAVTTSATGWQGYGIKSVESEVSTTAAGRHPDWTLRLEMNPPKAFYSAKTDSVAIKLPPGFYGNPTLPKTCSTGEFLTQSCPIDSQVGVQSLEWLFEGGNGGSFSPIYNLAPAHPDREIARFGFIAVRGLAVFIDVSVRTAGDYGITTTIHSAPSLFALIKSETVIWGNPADPSHNKQRMTSQEAQSCPFPKTACNQPNEETEPEDLEPIAFMTNPSPCGPWSISAEATSYQLPGETFAAEAPMKPGPVNECQGLPFGPELEARPTTDVAGAPTGLNSSVRLPQGTDPGVPSTATMREVRVTLPEGMTINPSAADGLAACSDEQIHFHEEVDAECPDASKLGTLKIVSPAVAQPIEGAVYQRSPEPGHLFRLWLVTDELGLHVKIPWEAKPDPNTGQLTAVFSDLPQVPVKEIDVDVWGGARAPLKNPDTCGQYTTSSVIAPWSSDPAATPSDTFAIDRGPGGGPCSKSAGEEPNSPGFEAGTVRPVAGAYSPALLRLHREDGSQTFGAFEVTLPPGLVAKLAGVAECSDAALAAAAHKSGREEQGAPSCPPGSLIGTLNAAAGAGPSPFWTQGKVYLAGPYKGAPLSVAAISPAVAGPFDLGNVVVRSALYVDPETAKVTVKTDPLPTILEGVPLNLRTVAVQMDRDRFTRNGTSCEPLAFSGGLTSTLGNVAPLSRRFQLGECRRLKFKPKLAFSLKGGTKRAEYPALTTTFKAGKGNADLSGLKLALPHSEFLAQEHLVTICTRVQFAAHKCPKGAVYGHVKAWSPLLSKPLKGPVYLRSSTHPLPDLVLDLRGQIEIAAVGRIDSHKGGIRVSFEALPDAPVSKAVVKMKGGPKGILVNSTDICQGRHKATANLKAHNGRRANLRPTLVSSSCGKKPHHHKRKHR